MRHSSSIFRVVWAAILVGTTLLLISVDSFRINRIKTVSRVAGEHLTIDPRSATGYQGAVRELLVPGQNDDSYAWILQTQQMFLKSEMRVRHIDYENAPLGRAVFASSPYRWWLGLISWTSHMFSGRSIGLSVEDAALVADPILRILALLGTSLFIASQFGIFASAITAIGFAFLYPFACGFLPGAPDSHGLSQVTALWSVLALLAGTWAPPNVSRTCGRKWFFVAGILGGFGMWVDVTSEGPVLIGIVLGALLAEWMAHGPRASTFRSNAERLPWREWALGGSATCLVAYIIDYFPPDWGPIELRAIHPLYGISWLGVGRLLADFGSLLAHRKLKRGLGSYATTVVAFCAAAGVPVAMLYTSNLGMLSADLHSFRLTGEQDGMMAPNLAELINRGGSGGALWATLLPMLVVMLSAWLMVRHAAVSRRVPIGIALGPVLVAVTIASFHLSWWQTVDALLLALSAAALPVITDVVGAWSKRVVLFLFVASIALPGALLVFPKKPTAGRIQLGLLDAESLVERDLSHWLAKRSGSNGRSIALAPPGVTSRLEYYGGMQGLGTFSWEDKDGLTASLRIVSSNSIEESEVLIRSRGVRYIVLPSWDTFFEDFTRPAAIQPGELFISAVHRWALPNWLRPIPFQVPVIGGFEGQTVIVLEVLTPQDDASALGRLAEYFVEMRQLDVAETFARPLERFPANPGALAALAQIEAARGETDGFDRTFRSLLLRLNARGNRSIAWDRRVSVAVVLARGNRLDLARNELLKCLAEIDETRIRSLTTASLYDMLQLTRAFGLKFGDESQDALAEDLLPSELRLRL